MKELKDKELKGRRLRNREIKIRKEIEELFFKPIKASIDHMDKLEEKEMMKKTPLAKNIWYNWYN